MKKRTCYILFSDLYTGSSDFQNAMKTVLNCEAINISQLFRRQLKMENVLTTKIKEYLNSGKVVPTKLVVDIIRQELSESSADFVIAGFPRSIDHFKYFSALLDELGIEVGSYWYLEQLKPELAAQKLSQKYSEKYMIHAPDNSVSNRIIKRQKELKKIVKFIGVDLVNVILCDPRKSPFAEVELISLIASVHKSSKKTKRSQHEDSKPE